MTVASRWWWALALMAVLLTACGAATTDLVSSNEVAGEDAWVDGADALPAICESGLRSEEQRQVDGCDQDALLNVLDPLPEGTFGVALGTLVLVDDASQPIPTANPDYPLFVLHVTAFTQRDGTTAFNVEFNNASQPGTARSIPWQCLTTRRGILTTDNGTVYQFAEDAEADTGDGSGFDLGGVECDDGQVPEVHEASELFDTTELTIAPSQEDAITITSRSSTWRFMAIDNPPSTPSETSVAPPTTAE